jgi:hypothetical protein
MENRFAALILAELQSPGSVQRLCAGWALYLA